MGALALLAGGAASLAAQAPRTSASHALRVSANFPLLELARDSLRTVSLGATPALGVALLPTRGPLQRVLLDAAPAMLRVDPGNGCTQLNGYTCESQALYGLTLSAAAETGARARLGQARLLYAVAGPALRLSAYVAQPTCAPDALPCNAANHYGSAKVGIGAHAAVGMRRLAPGRHLSTEAAATLVTYPGARTQLDVGVTVAFPF
ncbi:MAG TPA: hypothetical protein VF832_03200 [Longimicrobiales bacterium]